MQFFALYFCAAFLFLPGCTLYKKKIYSCSLEQKFLILDFVNNSYVFDSLSSLVYEELYMFFSRKGYVMKKEGSWYRLQVAIIDLVPVYKYVSSETLLFHVDMQFVIECVLIDSSGNVKDKKQFKRNELVSRPNNPVFKESFERFVYKKMLKKMMPEVERYFKKYWSNQD